MNKGRFKHAVIFHPALPPQGERTRACEPGPTIAVRYAYEPQGIVEGHGTLKTRGPVCWSVPWPGAVEAEGLTRVPSAVCDCAHGGRVVKGASIAGLFRSRGISGSDVARKSNFLRDRGVGKWREICLYMW